MADRRSLRLRWFAVVVALMLAVGAMVVLVVSLHARDDARADLAAARVALRRERAASSTSATALAAAHGVLSGLGTQLPTVGPEATAIAELDDQDLTAVRAALQAGLTGDLDAYNQAVDQRDTLDPEHDTALEQLRQQANAIITALDRIRG
jgi:hypothetical protein